jgi:c-di-GMP-binding flagellar brake protein YcgR
MPLLVSAEVLDISPGGALLSTSAVIEPGERAHLRLLLDGEPFNTWVEVLRIQPGTMDGKETRHRVGVSFNALDDSSRRTLQRFVKD